MSLFSGFWGLFALIILGAIIFVRAGQLGGQNGGAQTATILDAAGGNTANIITALEGGSGSGVA